MVDEGIRQYFDAKRLASDNVLGVRHGSPVQLPSNREIRAAVVARSSVNEGAECRRRHLFELRIAALQVMQALGAFSPRCIGSVASGCTHRTSDIDIQVFCDSHSELEHALLVEGWCAERVEHEVFNDGRFRRFIHFHFEHRGEAVELSVYEPRELWRVSISSVDGKPIDRVPRGRLLAVVKRAHPEWYAEHLENACSDREMP
jgi:hypothetical protein